MSFVMSPQGLYSNGENQVNKKVHILGGGIVMGEAKEEKEDRSVWLRSIAVLVGMLG